MPSRVARSTSCELTFSKIENLLTADFLNITFVVIFTGSDRDEFEQQNHSVLVCHAPLELCDKRKQALPPNLRTKNYDQEREVMSYVECFSTQFFPFLNSGTQREFHTILKVALHGKLLP